MHAHWNQAFPILTKYYEQVIRYFRCQFKIFLTRYHTRQVQQVTEEQKVLVLTRRMALKYGFLGQRSSGMCHLLQLHLLRQRLHLWSKCLSLKSQSCHRVYTRIIIPFRQDDRPAEQWDGFIGSAADSITVLDKSVHSFMEDLAENPSPALPASTE